MAFNVTIKNHNVINDLMNCAIRYDNLELFRAFASSSTCDIYSVLKHDAKSCMSFICQNMGLTGKWNDYVEDIKSVEMANILYQYFGEKRVKIKTFDWDNIIDTPIKLLIWFVEHIHKQFRIHDNDDAIEIMARLIMVGRVDLAEKICQYLPKIITWIVYPQVSQKHLLQLCQLINKNHIIIDNDHYSTDDESD